jgi:hypothetical protein
VVARWLGKALQRSSQPCELRHGLHGCAHCSRSIGPNGRRNL